MSLKDLADKIISRNQPRNSRATLPENARNFCPISDPEKLRGVGYADPDRLTREAEDLAEHFTERAAILEHDANLSREHAEAEAAKMTATLARNRGYTWAALRLAFRDYPAILALLPDRPGVVDTLPLGVAKLVIHPRHGVMPQGAHHAPNRGAARS
jgi:hypothetical protein